MTFQPGQSGNPAGRPPGIKDRRTIHRQQLLDNATEIIAAAVSKAKDGDVAAQRLCLERILPPVKSDPVYIAGVTDSIADNSRLVIRAIAEGELTPDDGATVLSALASQARVQQITDFEERLAALEAKSGKS